MSKIVKFILAASACVASLQGAPSPASCSSLVPEMQQFAQQLTPANQAIFCTQFSDAQRASAMQMSTSPDSTGAMTSPNEAVQKVVGASGSNPQGQVPTGCPVK